MEKEITFTTDYLAIEITNLLINEFHTTAPLTVKTIGRILCGENWKLAEEPFSAQFLENVAYNSSISFKLVLWLQLNKLQTS